MEISIVFWSVYLLIGLGLYWLAMYALKNDPDLKDSLIADMIKMNANKVMIYIVIGWLPLIIVSLISPPQS